MHINIAKESSAYTLTFQLYANSSVFAKSSAVSHVFTAYYLYTPSCTSFCLCVLRDFVRMRHILVCLEHAGSLKDSLSSEIITFNKNHTD